MKSQLRNQLAALFLLLPAAASMVALPATAASARAAPEIFELQVDADGGLSAGSLLEFTLEGTPRGQARVRIPGTNVNLALKETERGIYTGSYTVRRADRIDPAKPLRASLSSGKRTVYANYNVPASLAPQVAAAPPVIVPPLPAAPQPLRIDRFVVAPISKLEPGAELSFSLDGLAGATATLDIPGVITGVPMREVRPGRYEGSYTVRRQDNFNPAVPVVATLRSGDRVVTANLNRRLVTDNAAPVIGNLVPRQGETVTGIGPTLVSGTFDDTGGTLIDPSSVRILLSGRDITSETQVTPQAFTFRGSLPPGRHTVDVTAKDRAGNATQRTWTFQVGTSLAAAPSVLSLQVLSPGNNATVDGTQVVVQGRTAPGALVRVKVDAISPIAGNRFSVAQSLVVDSVQADAQGNFSFNFGPQRSLSIPGTRYEVLVTASQNGQSAESKLVLFQRPG